MKIVNRKLSELKRYGNNPRINEQAVKGVAESIRQFGYSVPIVIDETNTIICGDTRYQACKLLAMESVDCVLRDDLNDAQIRAYRILDNKVAEKADWDYKKLEQELTALLDFDFSSFDVDFSDLLPPSSNKSEAEEVYSKKIKAPIYEPTGKRPAVSELFDTRKANELISKINQSKNIVEEVRTFLIAAAARHVVFDYQQIAEFYAHADAELQVLMEDSALVIIDFEKAIENGFVALSEELAESYLQNERSDETE